MWALKILHENWRVSLCVQETVTHKIFSELLQPFRYVGMARSPRSWSWSTLFFGVGFMVGFVNSCSSEISEEHGSPRSCPSTRSLDTAAGCYVGWSISCLEAVMDVEEGKLEDELVDKPGTTIGTKFFVLHWCPNAVFNEMCFLTGDPLIRVSVFIAKLSQR